jgi:hypothetical protein
MTVEGSFVLAANGTRNDNAGVFVLPPIGARNDDARSFVPPLGATYRLMLGICPAVYGKWEM